MDCCEICCVCREGEEWEEEDVGEEGEVHRAKINRYMERGNGG